MKIAPMTLALCFGVCFSTSAQDTPGGLLLGAPLTVIAGAGTGAGGATLATNRLYSKPVGYEPFLVDGPPGIAGAPAFTAAALFGSGGAPPGFAINALSVGLDVLPVLPPVGGICQVDLSGPGDPWGLIGFSVTRASKGVPGSLIRLENDSDGGAGADFFTYVLPGSVFPLDVADCYPVDEVQVAIDGIDMDLSDSMSEGEISALDFFMPAYEVGAPLTADLDQTPTVYFSVTYESIHPPGGGPSPVPHAWFDPPFGLIDKTSGTVLQTTWNNVSSTWSTPSVLLSFMELGLGPNDDLDALAVDETACTAMFSIRRHAAVPPSPISKQLQVVIWCSGTDAAGGTSVGDLYATDETGSRSVAGRMEVAADDDIDSVCTEDPASQGLAADELYGEPLGAFKPDNKTFASSMFRDRADPQSRLTLMLEGLSTTSPPQLLGLLVDFPMSVGHLEPLLLGPVGLGTFQTHRQLTLADAALMFLDEPMRVIPLVGGGGLPLACAPTLRIQL
ncbi:MAG: hypothetical protein DRQ55_11970 [Planctomycetota bacterium]|nr:MAG: hypothetical protein DRQ55_11970 [Planctomycetota bacterium]